MPRTFRLAPSLLLALTLAAATLASAPARAVTFVNSGASLLGVSAPGTRIAIAWGDYDGDGDLDLLATGSTTGTSPNNRTRLYRNDGGGAFTTIPTALPNIGNSGVAWGDYDRDGDLDLALTGVDSTSTTRVSRVYRNDGGGTFTDLAAGLPGLAGGAVAWADYDGDGDLDLALSGTANGSYSGGTLGIYRNDAGTFVDAAAGLAPLGLYGALAWGDVDGDGDPDLLATGYDTAPSMLIKLYRNDAGTFTELAAGLAAPGERPALAFGDLDADGDLDLAMTGSATTSGLKLYRNDGSGSFTPLANTLTGLQNPSLAWGDADGDGMLDLACTGWNSTFIQTAYLARNNGGGSFTQQTLTVTPVADGALAWGDYDQDGRLDLAVAGLTLSNARIANIWRNTDALQNAAPAAPTGLGATIAPGSPRLRTTLQWSAPTDDRTPTNGLTYELRIGTTPGGSQVYAGPVNAATGLRRVAALGNAGPSRTWDLSLPNGTYYWSVQAVDASLAGGPFAAEQTLVVQPLVDSGVALTGARGAATRAAASWGDADGDGDLDLVIAGSTTGTTNTAVTSFYRNTSGTFASVPTGLPNLVNAAFAWADFDGDGDLDLAASGITPASIRTTAVYRNDGSGSFTAIGAGFTGTATGALAWADFDLDGDFDLATCGTTNGSVAGAITRLYRNDGGTFVDSGIALTGVAGGAMAWGDIDGDGDPDLFVSGIGTSGGPVSSLYRNDAGVLTALASVLPGAGAGGTAFGDYDGDGDLDLAIAGNGVSAAITRIYTNDGSGAFTLLGTTLTSVSSAALAWGDYDGDGDLDLAFAGLTSGNVRITRIARNDGGGAFTELDLGLTGVNEPTLAWGDYDGDGDLDLALAGFNGSTATAKLYRNVGASPNTAPGAPTGLLAEHTYAHTVLRWTKPADAQSPTNALSYDVRIGVTQQGGQVVSLPADSVSGWRRVPRRGAAQADSFVVNLPAGLYYFTVQAVDPGFAGSALPAWQTVVGGVLGVDDEPHAAPAAFAFRGVAPNPLVHSGRVTFDLPRESDVDLAAFDVTGRRVATLLRARFAAGRQAVDWAGRDDQGRALPAGVYLLRLAAGGRSLTQRVVLAR